LRSANLNRAPILGLALVCAGCGTGSPLNDSGPTDSTSPFAEDRDPRMAQLPFADDTLIVRSLPGASAENIAAALAAADAVIAEDLPEIETTILRVEPDRLVDVGTQLADHPTIEAVQKDYYFQAQLDPDDPRFGDQTHLTIIGLPDAWEISTGSAAIISAVLDSGVDVGHADLGGRFLTGRNTFEAGGTTLDEYGHGTLVAGVLGAASNNRSGIAGVNWAGPILPVRVTDESGRASSRAIASGLVWASQRGARVINVSFAPLQADGVVRRATRYVFANGGLVFISAGNDGQRNADRGAREAVFVGATDNRDALATFSSTGPAVDLAAPGVEIWSTSNDGEYRAVSGTSFASPIAAGVAALIWSARPELPPITVLRLLEDTAIDLGDAGDDEQFGAGRLDAGRALTAARDLVTTPDRTAPLVNIVEPVDNTVVEGTVRVSAHALDADPGLGVADVVLRVDGRAIVTDTAAPYRFALRTDRLAPGEHTVTCVAHDLAGNAGTDSVRIRVGGDGAGAGDDRQSNDTIPPRVIINFPTSGAIVTGEVGAQATLSDNLELARVEWLVDGVPRAAESLAGTRATTSFRWDATGADAGNHLLTVRATDASGNPGSATVVLIKE
jgi:thermitase